MTSYLLSILFYQWDPSIATSMEEECGLQGDLCWKISLVPIEYLDQRINFPADHHIKTHHNYLPFSWMNWNPENPHCPSECYNFVFCLPYLCGPMLVTELNVAWLLVRVLVAILFVTTTLASDSLLCQILLCPCCVCVWKIHGEGWHSSAGSSSDSQVMWVATLSSNSKNFANFLSFFLFCWLL